MTQAACVKHPPRLFSQGDEELKASQTMNQSINTHPSTLLVSQWGSANRGTVWLDECTDACSIDGNMVMTVESVEYSSSYVQPTLRGTMWWESPPYTPP